MKLSAIASAIAISIGATSAAPAIVWRNSANPSGPSHVSEVVESRKFLSSSINGNESSALAAVVFLVGRDEDGSEGFGKMASSGQLPGVQEKYNLSHSIHHNVEGIESARTVARDVRKSFDGKVVEVTLSEFNRKLSSIAQNSVDETPKSSSKTEQKRRREISEADVLVVSTGPNDEPATIDSSVVSAIESSAVRNVVLSSIRSIDEVKRARNFAMADRIKKSKLQQNISARRRLDDEGNNANNQNNQNAQGIYYVNMTPNIFAGLLFFFLFVFTAHLGLTCMNMIEGQDVYVKKMPHIGREV